jgi:hypothetical protein
MVGRGERSQNTILWTWEDAEIDDSRLVRYPEFRRCYELAYARLG